jgi:hypothetical protein
MQRMRLVVCAVALAVGACSGGPSTTQPTATGSASGNGAGIVLHATIKFSGFVAIDGTFDDTSLGVDVGTCADYAKNGTAPVAGYFGPQAVNVPIGGQTVSFTIDIGQSSFHGPGTYPGESFLALKIGNDIYAGGSDAITVNADGSGSTSFSNAQGHDADMVENGTITWTCTG